MRPLIRPLALAGVVVLAASLAACAGPQRDPYYSGGYSGGYQAPPAYQTAPAYPNQPTGTEYGRVSNIEVIQGQSQGRTTGAGTVLGAVVGGVLGNQVGKGSGRAAATAIGVVGGAVAGNAIEGRNNRDEDAQAYRVSIQLDQGGYRAYDVSSPGDLRIGDRVRVYNGQISRN